MSGVLTSLKRIGSRLTLLRHRLIERILLKRHSDHLYLIAGGHIFFQTLSAAVELDLFTLLAQHPGMTCGQIADRLKLQEKPVRILLLGCTSLGLLHKKGSAYFNSRMAQAVLRSDKPGNLLAVIRWQHHINYKAMHAFGQAIETNTNVGLKEFTGDEPYLYGRLTHTPELELIFQDAMQAISVQANSMLARYVDLSGYKHLVDVGGGNATNIITLANQYPHLRATVFDSASVCKIARQNIKNAGLDQRLDAIEGNCFNDPFPKDADCILFCHFFTIWSAQKNCELLEKCYKTLPPGGSVIVFNMMQSDREDGPLSAAMGSPYFLTLATGEGMLYTWKEYISWMKSAGFSAVQRLTLIRDHGVVIGTK